jgi:TP901 family phage tail tape measure protein
MGNAEKDLDKIQSRFEKMGSSIQKWAGRIDRAIQVAFVAGIARGIKKAADLDQAMRSIQSVGKQTDIELTGLSDTFIRMSTDITVTIDSAQNLAAAFYDIQGSGFQGADAMTVLEIATKAASAAMTDTATMVRGITGVLNSYGLEADKAASISDILFRTVDRGVGTASDLNSALAVVPGTAAQLGVSFDEVGAAMATMSKQGMNFDIGATSLNRALMSLIAPTDLMKQALAAAGYETGKALIEARGLGGALQFIQEAAGGSDEKLFALMGDIRGFNAVVKLTGKGSQMFAEDLAAMGNALGATDAAFATITKGAQAQFANFKNTLDALWMTIGNSLLPVLTSVMKVIGQLITAVLKLPAPIRNIIFAVTALVVALGPLKLLFGGIPAAIHGVIAAIGGLRTALTLLMAHPIIAAIVLGVALGVGIFLIFKDELMKLRQLFIDVFRSIGEAWDDFWARFGRGFQKIKDGIGNAVNGIKNFLGIGSPSKVFMDIGMSMAEGLGIGFNIASPAVINSVAQIAGQASAVVAQSTAQMVTNAVNTLSVAGHGAALSASNVLRGMVSGGGGQPTATNPFIRRPIGPALGSTWAPEIAPTISRRITPTRGEVIGQGGNWRGSPTSINIYPQGTSDQQLEIISRRLAEITRRRGV